MRKLDIYNNSQNLPIRGNALLIYIVHPFFIQENNPSFKSHINIRHTLRIVKILNDLRFCVDVIDYKDKFFATSKKYDIIIGIGEAFDHHKQYFKDKQSKNIFCYRHAFYHWNKPNFTSGTYHNKEKEYSDWKSALEDIIQKTKLFEQTKTDPSWKSSTITRHLLSKNMVGYHDISVNCIHIFLKWIRSNLRYLLYIQKINIIENYFIQDLFFTIYISEEKKD